MARDTDFESNNDYTTDDLSTMSSHELIRVHLKCSVFLSVLRRILLAHQSRQVRNNGVDFRLIFGSRETRVSSK